MSYYGLQKRLNQSPGEQRSYRVPDGMRRFPNRTQTKINVTPDSALTFGAFYAGIRILSQCQASLPIDLFERKGDGLKDVKVHEHPLSYLLKCEPNPYQTPVVYREERRNHELLWGDSFVEIRLDGNVVVDLQVHHPRNVEPFWSKIRKDRFGRPILQYLVRDDMTGNSKIVDSSMMIHVPYFGFNGLTGASVVRLAAQALGIGIATDRTAATFFGNSARPFLLVKSEKIMEDDQLERLQRNLQEAYTGDGAYCSLVLEDGLDASYPSMPLKDAQFLESRKFSGEEIAARWLGLPPHMAGYLDDANYSTLNEQNRSFVMIRLTPECMRDEQEMNRKLLSREDRKRFYLKYNVDGLLRGNLKDRYEAHRNALMSGWKTINEVRELEDLTPLPGGDELAKPASVYGSDPILDKPKDGTDPTQDPNQNDGQKNESKSSQRLGINIRGVVLQTIESHATAERIWLERLKPGPDVESRVREYYEQQTAKLTDRLPGARSEWIKRYHANHLAQVCEALSDSDPKAALTLAAEGWRSQPAQLTTDLLGA